ncbi:hypothetical protein AAFF_G00326970 [Aldrovandia affinis]|uniref:Uncharacterized protein n=1 Tax=Aldrovandia affinis TaxID=143900 RepID=A0AAD7X2B4_9TELE|nr:hypothetical protein AAFF_G00326970 [Aldrovandia affinis]
MSWDDDVSSLQCLLTIDLLYCWVLTKVSPGVLIGAAFKQVTGHQHSTLRGSFYQDTYILSCVTWGGQYRHLVEKKKHYTQTGVEGKKLFIRTMNLIILLK